MTRRYRRRKRLFGLKIKSQTLYTIFVLLIVSISLISILAFFQSGTALDNLKILLFEQFGFLAVLFPFVLLTFSFLFIKIKTPFTTTNVTLGFILTFICLLGLTQNGTVGQTVWNNFADLVSGIGAFILLSGMLLIGLIVTFNTSLEDVLNTLRLVYKYIFTAADLIFKKKQKPIFVEKLPVKPSTDYAIDKKTPVREQFKVQSINKQQVLPPLDSLGSGVISNLSSTHVWEYPPAQLLSGSAGQKADRGDMKMNAQIIEKTLESFGITARVAEVNLGPAVTQYALEITLGTKLSKITALSNDLALALAAPTGQIRIEAPIPGRSFVGIEIPNRSLEFVTLRQMLSSEIMKKSKDKLLVALGLDVSGDPVTANITRMPHVLIAGTTGSGKSVLINSWISSLLFRTTPTEVRLILVDPKRVELIGYNGIPHLLTPVIVEPDQILSALKWALAEMDRRYKLFAEVGVRNIDSYNELSGFQALPSIVIFIDELADLMAYSPVDVEDSICRLAQMARATGIHLVVATQRPSVDVITGLIKANIPTRLAFNVSSMIDSRVIIDMPGAEKLLGRGDMLYIPPDQAKPTRIQGTFISEGEVNRLVEFLKNKNVPVQYTQEVTSMPATWKKSTYNTQGINDGKDTLFEDALRVVCQYDRASASLLQRRLSIGYARAARILDQLESDGIVSTGEGSKPREVLVRNPDEYLANRGSNTNSA